MFHLADNQFVAGIDITLRKRVSQRVDSLGAALGKHNLGAALGVDKLLHLHPRSLVNLGGFFAEIMHSAVYVAVVLSVKLHNGVEHALRFLSGGGVVEIYKVVTVDFLVKNREVFAYIVDVHSINTFCLNNSAANLQIYSFT